MDPASIDIKQRAFLTRDGIESTLAARFEAAADHFSTRPALVLPEGNWSYAQLEARANGIARLLLEQLGEGSAPLPLLFPHGAWQIAALLGALKAGRACVVLDPCAPQPYLQGLIARLAPTGLLACGETISLATKLHPRCWQVEQHPEATRPAPRGGPGSPASIVFTSGSTGTPRGVMRSQRCILHRIWLYGQARGIRPEDRQSHLFSCCFVAAEADVWGALLNGAALCPQPLARLGLLDLPGWLADSLVSLLHPPVSWFRRAMRLWEEHKLPLTAPALRLVALAGEPVYGGDVARFRRLFPARVELVHRFSASETSNLTSWVVQGSWPVERRIPIGKPAADKHLRLAEPPSGSDADGELLIESRYLADGYWQDAEETARRFYSAGDGLRGFRSGDLLRRLPDGGFLHCGRSDQQLKLRGHRVEPSEVEGALLALSGVREAAVLAHARGNELELVACVSPQNAADGLRERLAERLPARLLPSRIIAFELLPLTATGKIDRQALASGLREDAQTAPRPLADEVLEARILRCFTEVLGRPALHQEASFWELGGDSILAAEVCARLGRELGRQIMPEALLREPTAAGLAGLLRARCLPSSVLVLAPGRGPGIPLCCVDTPMVFSELVQRLPPERRVLGLASPRLESIPAIAEALLEDLLAAQPRGPYALLGFSWGGVVAFELGRQLQLRGHALGYLGLVDTLGPKLGDSHSIRTPEWVQFAWHTALRVPVQLARLWRMPQQQRRSFLRARAIDFRTSLVRARGTPADGEDRMRRVRARARHRSQPLAGRLTLYRAVAQPPAAWGRRQLGWEGMADTVEVVPVPSVHGIAMLHEPLCGLISRHVQASLRALEGQE